MPADLAGPGIDLADMAFGELGHPEIVLRVRDDLVDRVPLVPQSLERLETLPFLGREIEPEDLLRADALRPYLAIDVMAQADEVQLHANVVIFRRQRIVFHLLGLGVEIAKRALEHRVEPERAVLVELEREIADGSARFELLNGILGEFERLRVELGDEQLAEIRIPDRALGVDEDVVRLGGRARQIVLGDDDARRTPGGTRQGFERVLPLRDLAEVDAGEVFGLFAELLRGARALRIEHALRLDRLAHRPITIHAHDDLGPFIRIVGRAHDAFERMATDAAEQEGFLILRAW